MLVNAVHTLYPIISIAFKNYSYATLFIRSAAVHISFPRIRIKRRVLRHVNHKRQLLRFPSFGLPFSLTIQAEFVLNHCCWCLCAFAATLRMRNYIIWLFFISIFIFIVITRVLWGSLLRVLHALLSHLNWIVREYILQLDPLDSLTSTILLLIALFSVAINY